MNVQEALETAQIDKLDAEIILSTILKESREYLLAHPERTLSDDGELQWKEWHGRRKGGEPLAYILGTKEFYGRQFIVTPAVLIPRPSTEGLVDLALDFLKTEKEEVRELDTEVVGIAKKLGDLKGVTTIVDVGTGSGCIAITLKKELPEMNIIGVDTSPEAIDVAMKNADLSVVKIYNTQGSLLEEVQNIDEDFVVVSNPPYIPSGEVLMKDVANHEPHEALFSGEDGGDIVRELILQAQKNLRCKGLIVECRSHHQKLFESLGD